MNEEEFISKPLETYHECLIHENIENKEDEQLQKALQESIKIEKIRLENEERIKYYMHLFNPLYIHFNFINYYYTNNENTFFIECLKDSLKDFIFNKTSHIYLFKKHYIDFKKIIDELYTLRIDASKKPKINEELFLLLKNNLKKI